MRASFAAGLVAAFLALGSAAAFHEPGDAPSREVVYVTQLPDGLNVLVLHTFGPDDQPDRTRVWVPTGAHNATLTLEDRSYVDSTRALADVGVPMWSTGTHTLWTVSWAAFDIDRFDEPVARLYTTFLVDNWTYEHRSMGENGPFRVFAEPLGNAVPTIDGAAPLLVDSVSDRARVFATPGASHPVQVANATVRVAFTAPPADPTSGSAVPVAAGVLGGLAVGVWVGRR